ncbi:MAG: protein kinase [Planctomycetota bacterium]
MRAAQYFYAARLNDFASSGQVLVSNAALGLLKDAGLEGVAFHHHGPRELRGIGSVDVHELLYDGAAPRPTRRQKAEEDQRRAQAREWTVLPATMGLTEYGRKQGSDARREGGEGSAGVATPEAPPVQNIGNYELTQLLGSGGMGAVYKARHKQFGRDRAVKIIKPHLLPHGDGDDRHEEVVRRFYREIKAAGALDHPNIVVAIDSSAPEDETHYLVMEYVDGCGADQLVDRGGPMPVGAACEFVRQAAVGLEYIHRQGMVHRDIKPSNLMVTLVDRAAMDTGSATGAAAAGGRAPVVKILDLGLALLVTEDQPRLTQLGHGAMGTAMYMSPEQWSTTSVDIRSDIYSLGCTLYHLVSGRPPFFDSDLRPQRAHEKAPVPTQYGRDDVPREFTRVLKKMMAKRPDERYGRPAEAAEALAALADPEALVGVAQRHEEAAAVETQRVAAGGETLAGGASRVDTLGPAPPTPMYGSWQPEPPRPLWRRLVTPAAVVAAIAAVFWMASIANQQQQRLETQREELAESRRKNLVIPSGLAASLLAGEIETRLDVLTRLSRDPVLLAAIAGIDTADRRGWAPLQAWIAEQAAAEQRVEADSWFLVAADGTQVARAPESGTIGKSFLYRDYFHGLGYHLPKDTTAAVEPTATPVLSAVYRSRSTQKLKVAFSVPVRLKPERGGQAEVIGVLGMSVDLGSFRVLDDAEKLPAPLEVVLVDLRGDQLGPEPPGGAPRRGLLLHHPELARLEVPEDPFRLPPTLLEQVQQTLKRRRRSRSPENPIIEGYQDLLQRPGRGRYVGAFQPVVLRDREGPNDTDWLVIVQQEMTD